MTKSLAAMNQKTMQTTHHSSKWKSLFGSENHHIQKPTKRSPSRLKSHRSVIATHTTKLSYPRKMLNQQLYPIKANGITTNNNKKTTELTSEALRNGIEAIRSKPKTRHESPASKTE